MQIILRPLKKTFIITFLLFIYFFISSPLCYALDVTYSLKETRGTLNNLLGVNAGPTPAGESTVDLTTAYQNIGVRQIRTHDYYGPLDLAVLYPDRTKLPSSQGSFNFSTAGANSFSSDYVFSSILNGGFEPYFRIGDSWNNSTPPKNGTERNNIAAASVNILKHYRQGLWSGFNSDFHIVEIWNEPNHKQFWPDPYTEDDFFLFYEALANSIRSAFPELKIGGPGFAPSAYLTTSGIRMVRRFLDYVKSRNLPLDFLSYHVYTDSPGDYITSYDFYRQELDTRGFNSVELHITEYNTETDFYRVNSRGAAINTSAWITMQEKGIKYAMFYRGNDTSINLPTFYGMFLADGRPKKSALAFKLWSQIYGLGNRLSYTQAGTATELYFLPATDEIGNIGALVANISGSPKTWKIEHQGRELTYLSKTLHTITDSSDDIVVSSPTSLEMSIGPYSVQYLLLKSYFSDVAPLSYFHNYISAIYRNGITIGCSQSPLAFCPSDKVTREQMAAFIIRAKEGNPPTNYCGTISPFNDVPASSNFCRYIKRLSELGITVGCGDGNFCPTQNVTREQMAAFIIRAKEGEPPNNYCDSNPPFADVPVTNYFCRFIKRMLELGITNGCGNGNFCPNQEVTREQMAAFIARAFLGM